MLEKLVNDDTWHDPQLAGYWIWGTSCWIGDGFLGSSSSATPRIDSSAGLSGHHIGHGDGGIHRLGLREKIPHIINGGRGIHGLKLREKMPHIESNIGEPHTPSIYAWFRQLSERLRHVRVVCGDWTRITGGDWQDALGVAGVFLDPPYGINADRRTNLYAQDCLNVAQDVQKWAFERGESPTYRIVLAGYYEEHENLLNHGWTVKRWAAQGGYSNRGEQVSNRLREALFLSPHCVNRQSAEHQRQLLLL